jgi:hypothetical protein
MSHLSRRIAICVLMTGFWVCLFIGTSSMTGPIQAEGEPEPGLVRCTNCDPITGGNDVGKACTGTTPCDASPKLACPKCICTANSWGTSQFCK